MGELEIMLITVLGPLLKRRSCHKSMYILPVLMNVQYRGRVFYADNSRMFWRSMAGM
jgi:hypothetical protein